MTATVCTYTVIHIGPHGPEPAPYAIVIVETATGQRKAGRVDGDVSWLAIGQRVEIEDTDAGLRVCPVGSG